MEIMGIEKKSRELMELFCEFFSPDCKYNNTIIIQITGMSNNESILVKKIKPIAKADRSKK
jgi:hypothetical protein